MLSYLPDTPQTTGKMRGAPRYDLGTRPLYSHPMSPLVEIDETRFPHSAQMAEERAFAAWRAAAVTTSDQYYYASSKFRPAPMPTFPPRDHWVSASELRSTYPLSGGDSSGMATRLSSSFLWPASQAQQHLPTANVYSRNISTTLTASTRLSSSVSARYVSPLRSTLSTSFSGTPVAHLTHGSSPTAIQTPRSSEKRLQPSTYFRDRLEMRDLSTSFSGRAAPTTPLVNSR
jgi:hypothetical protein